MTMDIDEFYDTEQFRAAYADIVQRNLTHTCCNIVPYVKTTVRYRDYETYFVSFINRIDHGEKFTFDAFHGYIPCLVDPTRRIKLRKGSRFCFLGKVVMHHMGHIRKNIDRKIINSTFSQTKENSKLLKSRYNMVVSDVPKKIKSGEYILVKNQFGIKI